MYMKQRALKTTRVKIRSRRREKKDRIVEQQVVSQNWPGELVRQGIKGSKATRHASPWPAVEQRPPPLVNSFRGISGPVDDQQRRGLMPGQDFVGPVLIDNPRASSVGRNGSPHDAESLIYGGIPEGTWQTDTEAVYQGPRGSNAGDFESTTPCRSDALWRCHSLY